MVAARALLSLAVAFALTGSAAGSREPAKPVALDVSADTAGPATIETHVGAFVVTGNGVEARKEREQHFEQSLRSVFHRILEHFTAGRGASLVQLQVDQQPAMGPASTSSLAVSAFTSLIFTLIVALIYDKGGFRKAAEESDITPETDGFHFGIFDCDECCGRDQKICLCAMCCPMIRWADTISQDKVKAGIGFWALLVLAQSCRSFDALTAGVSLVVFVGIAVFFRQKLRLLYGVPSGTFITYLQDALLWLFCGCCTAVQEARQVEHIALKAQAV